MNRSECPHLALDFADRETVIATQNVKLAAMAQRLKIIPNGPRISSPLVPLPWICAIGITWPIFRRCRNPI